MKNNKKTVREIALEVLDSVEKNQSYSNLLLNNMITKHKLTGPDVGLLTELSYGTIQRKMTLDYYLTPFVNFQKTQGWIINLLRLSLYQLIYLDKVPDHAVIFEAVEIAKKRGHKGNTSMVNGVLRNIQRKGVPSLDEIKDPAERISIETSHPQWIVERWIRQFGYDKTLEMCKTNLLASVQTARVNIRKTSRNEVLSLLREEGFEVEPSLVAPDGIKAIRGNLTNSEAFKAGFFTIQDESSMLVGYAIGAGGDEQVLDACAAPGGKSTHIAERLSDKGRVISLDLHEHKVKLIKDQAERLGLDNIKTRVYNSKKVQEIFGLGQFNRILIDAPCSGLGVMRRKPDIKYTKSQKDINSLSEIQLELLDAAAPLVTRGGTLVYSTCTVDKEENENVALRFLEKHTEFEEDYSLKDRLPEPVKPLVNGNMLQVFPQDFGSDGFFIACFKRKVK
ncbi:16S rRNA (cytosine967-C5)-methyltransferase [Peribacillus deserti]|uniref:16S rRNA (cytosine(967)-C(5))-methyltransferase n=1 Tax=Peribacillus deserti TaxID=673318 RepID=A0ABS2QGP3_9BACI|nr:16S rRNA (cytosine(967)-C(5))-methyltransferase RsmB [Peribacillus deserti]MBM7692319.1 16S rRNA (cytosine967-C5)-methyltransferase [Peribacillus deserti]